MDKYMDLPLDIKIELIDSDLGWLVTINFPDETISQFCLGLCLVRDKLIKNLVVFSKKVNCKIHLSADESVNKYQRAVIKQIDDKKIYVILSVIEIEFLTSFFLKYVRDGYAEVPHIDIEVPHTENPAVLELEKENPLDYIVLKFEKVGPSISVEELRKRMKKLD